MICLKKWSSYGVPRWLIELIDVSSYHLISTSKPNKLTLTPLSLGQGALSIGQHWREIGLK